MNDDLAGASPVDRTVRQREPSTHVAWCRYVTKHDKPTRIVLCDSDAEGAFPVFRRPHDRECTNDHYARSVCEGMWIDKCDDVNAMVEALQAVYALAGQNKEVARIVNETIAKHGGPEVAQRRAKGPAACGRSSLSAGLCGATKKGEGNGNGNRPERG